MFQPLRTSTAFLLVSLFAADSPAVSPQEAHDEHDHHLQFSLRSVKSGAWSDPATWEPARVPAGGDRVLVARGTEVVYDVRSEDVLRLVQVVGTLRFSTERSTEMNVGVIRVQDSEHCSESGFACDFHAISERQSTGARRPELLIGTPEKPIPAGVTAKVRLHYLEGFAKDDAPAIACCGGRMEIHGAPLAPTWFKLDANVEEGAERVTLAGDVSGWQAGDEVIITGSYRSDGSGSFREGGRRQLEPQTEPRKITAIDGRTLTLDRPLSFAHLGEGEFRSEVANLSRNVVIESADPAGVRGHTVYHRHSKGSLSYARFAHLGKEGLLGRYALHFHVVDDTMRGSSVVGLALVDSHNRWITIHGTEYLVVRDCVGYKSVGHGFFLEDGTEVYNLLERNLGVHAYRGKRLPDQVLPFDENDGAAFWWANGRNTIVGNVGCESDEYGFRYDMQLTRSFDCRLAVRDGSGEDVKVDVRTIPIWRFDDNEAHGSFAGMVLAANGGTQPDTPIRDERMLERIREIDWTGPDTRHPHRVRNFKIWAAHYAFRPHSPSMRVEGMRIHDAAYGIYRPAFEDQEYIDLHISDVGAEPFNRGMDDASAQTGSISVDGLIFETGYGNSSTPLVQLSDNDLSGDSASHFRNVEVRRPERFKDRWPLFNRGVGPRVPPVTPRGVPVFVHDHFGAGRHAKIVSTSAKDLIEDGNEYRAEPPFTGDEARVAEVGEVEWPRLLDPVDDEAPATIVLGVEHRTDGLFVRGVSHDNGEIASVKVNEKEASVVAKRPGVVDWEVTLDGASREVEAWASDDAGNVERARHWLAVGEPAEASEKVPAAIRALAR